MALIITEEQEIIYPTFERIEQLKTAGIDTDGDLYYLVEIMVKKGLKMPYECKEGFRFELMDKDFKRYTFIYLTLVDAIAEKLILINT